ncbi:uracil-DNA glycosylase [Candidatus Woesearchaeota archaeon]|nr:uracil-DNA glycosylase [Candidatus Woesearchaeota archaeon]
MSKQESLNSVKERILASGLPLKSSAKNLVFGKGNPDAKLMFIGEAPGEQEDIQGLPFVGAAGKELDKLLRSIGLSLDAAYIANILKYRPPMNRSPNPEEIKAHTPYLVEQIKILSPNIIITLGNFSTKFVLGGFDPEKMATIDGITKLHGKEFTVTLDGQNHLVVPLFHPAAMLHNPQLRPLLEEDFKKLKIILESNKESQRTLL